VHLAASGYGYNLNTAGLANVGVNTWDQTPAVFDNIYYSDTTRIVSTPPVLPLTKNYIKPQ
jgi:hypothetical protein